MLFCVGGRGGSGDPFRSIECYSISKNSWFFGPEMNSRRRHVGVISVGGNAGGGEEGEKGGRQMEVDIEAVGNTEHIINGSMDDMLLLRRGGHEIPC